MNLKKILIDKFSYSHSKKHSFIIPQNSNNIESFSQMENENIFMTLKENLNYLKIKYNSLINSDIVFRNFIISINNINLNAFLIFIDGMVDNDSINNNILKPLLLKNSITMKKTSHSSPASIKFKLKNFIYQQLIPQNSIKLENKFNNIYKKINSGYAVLFIDKCNKAFCIETKKIKGRTDSKPQNETIVRGAQEAFVENLRTNTGLIRKTINNENLIIENFSIGKITNTSVAICYMANLTNENLIAEVKYRIQNLEIDSLISSGELEQLITDNKTIYPEIIATERNDRTCNYLLAGKVAIIVNGSPYALIVPAVFTDFLSSPEDYNLNYYYGNFMRIIRGIAFFFSIFLPGFYIAITTYHQELIPSELLFAIASAREGIPFPIIFEIILMEVSFDLIREAGIRVPSPFGQTIGIIGALVLGDAAVSANIVSPILIIIVAFTGICNFAIPDFSLSFSLRILRFAYIFLGYIAGLLGIVTGFFIHLSYLLTLTSFGVSYFSPQISSIFFQNSYYTIKPIWKREYRNKYLNTKKPFSEKHISMKWKKF